MGPSAPPAAPPTAPAPEYDDDVGPQPLPAGLEELSGQLERQQILLEVEARARKKEEENVKEKRDTWMLVPPAPSRPDAAASMKSRQFNRTNKDTSLDPTWVALPGERVEPAPNQKKRKADDPPKLTEADIVTQKFVEQHNKKNRPSSLVELHSKEYITQKKFETEDIGKKRFDRDSDLSSRKASASTRQKLIEDAGALDTKFSRGAKKFL
ncbi:hypothetical protein HK101_002629 [Irineochytrium annulatum]|nr:hypothetical protein HK101_002629 [Irineochytrium annulatum]